MKLQRTTVVMSSSLGIDTKSFLKMVVDNYIKESCDVTSVDSMQFCGSQLFIVDTSLQENRIYIEDEIHNAPLKARKFYLFIITFHLSHLGQINGIEQCA